MKGSVMNIYRPSPILCLLFFCLYGISPILAGENAEALEYLQKAKEAEFSAHDLAKQNPGPPSNEELGLLLDAIEWSEKAIHITPKGEIAEAAYLRIARAEIRCGRYWQAFLAVENSFPVLPAGQVPEASRIKARITLEKHIADALYDLGLRPIPGAEKGEKDIPINGYAGARQIYRAIVVNDRLSKVAPESYLRYAECALKMGDKQDAEDAYRSIIYRDFSAHPIADQARAALVRLILDKYKGKTEDIPRDVRVELDALQRVVRINAEGEDFERNMSSPVGQYQETPSQTALRLKQMQEEKDEAAAAALVRQAQAQLNNIKTDKARKSGLFLLQQTIDRYPQTPSAEVAKTLIKRYDRW